ncbi:MAG: lytic transglycosylase domain-containing protein [Myxococcales bacterium]|nr:lytic transglycosylase domain-containing protein [Myxococcales bacterium]
MRRLVPVVLLVVVAVALLAAAAPVARADIYEWTDAEGVVHFTNLEPKGEHKKTWKVVYRNGPGKAAARRGRCERCDVVPANERSRDRFARYDAHIFEAIGLYQIPEALVRAVIKVESDYDPRVVSSAGARGLMQLMPSVVKDMRVGDVHDPRDNVLGGTRLLRVLANRFDGDLSLTIAAYHAGAGAVLKYGRNIPPYETTQRYVKMVLKQYRHFQGLPATRSASR